MKRDDFKISCQALIYAHKNASENNIALQKKFFSTFKMACLDFYVGHLSNKSSCYFYEKKKNSHFCLEARG